MQFIIDLWLDGYDTNEEMRNACIELMKQELDTSASSLNILDEEKLKEKYVKELSGYIDSNDVEMSHYDADGLLCELLSTLGYKKVVDIYKKISKWYA